MTQHKDLTGGSRSDNNDIGVTKAELKAKTRPLKLDPSQRDNLDAATAWRALAWSTLLYPTIFVFFWLLIACARRFGFYLSIYNALEPLLLLVLTAFIATISAWVIGYKHDALATVFIGLAVGVVICVRIAPSLIELL